MDMQQQTGWMENGVYFAVAEVKLRARKVTCDKMKSETCTYPGAAGNAFPLVMF
jgi:hypothetical protein